MSNFLYLLQGIPESIATLALSLTFARISLRWLPIVIGGAIISMIGSAIKLLPFAMGLNSVAMLVMCVFFIANRTTISVSKSFIVTISSAIILIFLEILFYTIISELTTLNLETVPTDSVMWYLMGLPQAILMLVMALLISKYFKPISDGWKK